MGLMARKTLPFLAGATAACLLLLFGYCAPLEFTSVTVYAGFAIASQARLVRRQAAALLRETEATCRRAPDRGRP